MKIFVINPGSTSTKVALFEDENLLWEEKISYLGDELKQYKDIFEQYDMRLKDIKEIMNKKGLAISELSAIVGRGGLAMPFKSGAYKMNDNLKKILRESTNLHSSILGGLLAYDLAGDIPSFIYDPVSIDELQDIARISGIKGIERVSMAHFLNIRACCHKVAKDEGKTIRDLNFIVAHLGGGTSIAAISKGMAIDVVTDDEGAFTPERCGAMQLWSFTEYCFKHDEETMKKLIRGQGGVMSYLGTVDMIEVENRIKSGDKEAKLIYDAMGYQIAKSIASLSVVHFGKVDKIILTGGLANTKMLTNFIKERISFLGEVLILPGEHEMKALSEGALRVLRGEEEPHIL